MALSNVIPEVWRKIVLASLRKSLPAQMVANKNFREEVWGMGDTLHILSLGNLADAAYTDDNITYSDPTDATTDLLIDKSRYVAFKDEDAVKAKTNVNYLSELLTDAGYQLADYWDDLFMSEYANAGINNYATGTTPWQFTATTCANVPAFFASIVRDLKEANAPAGKIFLIAPPTVEEAVNIYFGGKINASADAAIGNGFSGKFFGVNMYVSNNVKTSTNIRALAGVEGSAIALANDVITDEGIRLEGRMATGYRMLSIGGIKTYRPAISVDVNINTTTIATS
jgi:hypothetical protein